MWEGGRGFGAGTRRGRREGLLLYEKSCSDPAPLSLIIAAGWAGKQVFPGMISSPSSKCSLSAAQTDVQFPSKQSHFGVRGSPK
jgi:hypothetical protein